MEFRLEDCRADVFVPGGPCPSYMKRDESLRVTHLPTGLVAQAHIYGSSRVPLEAALFDVLKIQVENYEIV